MKFRSRTRLSDHRAVHRGDTFCLYCSRVFNRIEHLRAHMLRIHQVVLPLRRQSGATGGPSAAK